MPFVDVGQGDAIWIQTDDDGIDGNGIFEGYTIVIDGGPYSADNSNPFLPYMEKQGHHLVLADLAAQAERAAISSTK